MDSVGGCGGCVCELRLIFIVASLGKLGCNTRNDNALTTFVRNL